MSETSSAATSTGSAAVVTAKGENTDSWRYRRRFMLAITAFCMVVIILSLFYGRQIVGQIIVTMGFSTLISIFGFYVVGSTWDDHSLRQFQTNLASIARGKQQSPTTETAQ